jgi:acyl-lipid omega-6 desaturase (Delta-12 desaturase)
MRTSKQLLLDSRPFAKEQRIVSWWVFLSTVVAFAAAEWLAGGSFAWWVRIPASIVAGLLIVRIFILYHDYEHGTILKKSPIAWAFMKLYGLLTLNPPSIWKRSHDHHHKHNAKLFGASIGSFPVMTLDAWMRAPLSERFAYAITRHPLTLALGYFTVFLWGMCIRSLLVNPRLHWDSALSLVVHAGLSVALVWFGGWDVYLLCMLLPSMLASAMGAYLFYAQHNFPGVRLRVSAEWDYVGAALEASSYCHMSPIMAWFTGNIGYHHVHHLNHHIPFYRLPETMKALEELQSPTRTTLLPWDVIACLRLKLWDTETESLVPFPSRRQRHQYRLQNLTPAQPAL